MKAVTAKELKNQTGKVLKMVKAGQKVLITMRSKPFAVLSPVSEQEMDAAELRPYEQAWEDIQKTLRTSQPKFSSLHEAMKWTRRRR